MDLKTKIENSDD